MILYCILCARHLISLLDQTYQETLRHVVSVNGMDWKGPGLIVRTKFSAC